MKSILAVYCCFVIGRLLAQTDSSNYELLWEVSGRGLKNPSYIFGSMHSNDARLFQFPDTLYTAFVNADAVVLETDISSIFDLYDVRLDLFNLDLFDKQRSMTVSKKATTTVYGSEDGRPQFLDAYFQQTAYCSGKLFYPLETLQDQLDVSEELDKMSVRATFNTIFLSTETVVQKYMQGDIAALSKMLRAQLKGMPGAYDALISNRNRIMATGLDTLMKKQRVFCAIGSGHLHGSDGVIQLLRSKGYAVRAVKATYSEESTADKLKMLSWRNFQVNNDRFHFSIVLNGKPLETIEDNNYRLVYQELGQGNSFELLVHSNEDYFFDAQREFIVNSKNTIKQFELPNGAKAAEGLVKDPLHGYQWKRLVKHNGFTYELICFGGNKFMHSNRPQIFFDRLELK